jgi:hypothetical protein
MRTARSSDLAMFGAKNCAKTGTLKNRAKFGPGGVCWETLEAPEELELALALLYDLQRGRGASRQFLCCQCQWQSAVRSLAPVRSTRSSGTPPNHSAWSRYWGRSERTPVSTGRKCPQESYPGERDPARCRPASELGQTTPRSPSTCHPRTVGQGWGCRAPMNLACCYCTYQ